jgi:hypothetical protein
MSDKAAKDFIDGLKPPAKAASRLRGAAPVHSLWAWLRRLVHLHQWEDESQQRMYSDGKYVFDQYIQVCAICAKRRSQKL